MSSIIYFRVFFRGIIYYRAFILAYLRRGVISVFGKGIGDKVVEKTVIACNIYKSLEGIIGIRKRGIAYALVVQGAVTVVPIGVLMHISYARRTVLIRDHTVYVRNFSLIVVNISLVITERLFLSINGTVVFAEAQQSVRRIIVISYCLTVSMIGYCRYLPGCGISICIKKTLCLYAVISIAYSLEIFKVVVVVVLCVSVAVGDLF